MAIVSQEQGASAAQMLVKCYNGVGVTRLNPQLPLPELQT